MRHFLTLIDFTKDEIIDMLNVILELKHNKSNVPYFKNKTLAMIFEKSSTRTRVGFEAAMYKLGGHAIFLSQKDTQLGRGEPIKDTARVISSMVDMVMMRTSEHSRLEEFAHYSSVPLINGLSDDFHPVQLIADYLTMIECGIFASNTHINNLYLDKTQGQQEPIVAYVGDGNNMSHSWINLAALLGFELRVATPKQYAPKTNIVEKAQRLCKQSGGKVIIGTDPKDALYGANVVATDTWASMGQEEEKSVRQKAFKGFCIDNDMMKLAKQNAIFLHCLPAYRGQEVSEEVFEGHQSRVFREAENRFHAQKGIMLYLARINEIPLEYKDL